LTDVRNAQAILLETEGGPALPRLPQGVRSLSFSTVVTVILLAVLFLLHGGFYDSLFVFSLTFAIVVVGMVLQVGYSHQLAFHQSVFMMAGAYGVAILSTKYHFPVWLAMILLVIGSALVGLLLGFYVTRVPGFALALATLFFSVIVVGFVEYNNYLGAQTGLGPVPYVINGPIYTRSLEYSGTVTIVLLGIGVYIVSRILNSTIGLELALMAGNETIAEGLGIITARRKLELFVLGSAFAALGGTVFATTQQFVTPATFSQVAEITFLVMLFLGGRTSILGGLIGAIGIEFLSGTSNWISSNEGIIEGVLITVVLLYFPAGLIGILTLAWNVSWGMISGHYGTRSLRQVLRQASAPGSGSPIGFTLRSRPKAAEPSVDELAAPAGVRVAGDGHALAERAAVSDRLAQANADAGGSNSPDPSGQVGGRLECRDLTKAFGGVVAVDTVSLAISGPGIYAICGPNGAGKTTFFELIAGGLKADEGEVWIDGVNATRMLPHERAQLGMARTLQTVRLMNARSVLDNVAVAALESHRTFMTRALVTSGLEEARIVAWGALERLGIAHLAERRPAQLTLEVQRTVELARAIVAGPHLLLLDEPASGLSVEQRERLSRTLQELAVDTTVVLVEHDLQMVARIAKQIFVLVDGRLVFSGDADGFLNSDVVRSELMGLVEEEAILETANQRGAEEGDSV
jgi:branched-chain amino acid transport system permease protein